MQCCGYVINYDNYTVFTGKNGQKVVFPGVQIDQNFTSGEGGWTRPGYRIHLAAAGNRLRDLEHEYGYYLQSLQITNVWYTGLIVPWSFVNALRTKDDAEHQKYWTERWANGLAVKFFGPNSAIANDETGHPR